MKLKISTAAERFHENPYLKVSIYGQSGVGKTEWACRSPRPLIAITEPQAMATVVDANPGALVVLIECYDDFHALFTAVKAAPRVVADDGQPCLQLGDHLFQTLVLDSFTDLQRMMIARLLGHDGKNAVDQLDFDATVSNLSLQQWGRVLDACTQVWRDQRALNCNTVFICLAETQFDSEGRRIVLPMLSGKKSPFQMGQYFNAQGICLVQRDPTTGASKHAIRWVADSVRYQTKPAPGWPSVIENTKTPGETTLGSLALYSAKGKYIVPHRNTDSAEFVEAAKTKASSDPDAAVYTEPSTAPATEPTEKKQEKKRRRTRAK